MSFIARILSNRLVHKTVIASLAFFFLMASYYVVKPLRNPILVKQFDKETLHIFYAITAGITLAGVFLYNYLVSLLPRTKLVRVFFAAILVLLVALWYLLQQTVSARTSAVIFFFAITVYITFFTSIFWSFNHDINTSQDAEKIYPFIMLGAQIGVIAGSKLTLYLSDKWMGYHLKISCFSWQWQKKIGDIDLLLITAGGMVLAWVFLEFLKIHDPKREENQYIKPLPTGAFTDIKLFFQSRYVLFIGLLVIFASLVPTLADYQYQYLVDDSVLYRDLNAPNDDHSAELFRINAQKNTVLDIAKPDLLAGKLAKSEDLLSKFLRDRLSPAMQNFLASPIQPLPALTSDQQLQIAQDLNQVLQSGMIYAQERFENIKLSRRVQRLIAENPQGKRLVILNRLLLEEFFSQECVNSQTRLQKDLGAENNDYMGWCNILMCLIITPLLVRFLGPAWAICLYPLLMAGGSVLFLQGHSIYTVRYFAVLALSLMYTLYTVGKEIFYVPTDKNTKYKLKALCDTFIFRFGDALASGVMAVYLAIVGSGWVFGLSYIILVVVIAIWIPVIFSMKKRYQEQITKDSAPIIARQL